MSTAVAWFFGCVLAVVAVVGTMLWWSYAATVMWGWFLVPLGLPALSIPQVVGISGTIGLIRGPNLKDVKDKEWDEMAMLVVIGPAASLLIGWIVLQFM